jgi:hypothetical protein
MEQPGGPASEEGPGGLAARVAALEDRLRQLENEVRTARLVIADDHGRERIAAELVDDVAELRISLPSTVGRRTGVLVFAIPGHRDLPSGIGLQLWVDGDLVRELTWWEDEELPPLT